MSALDTTWKKLRAPHMGDGPLFLSSEVEDVFEELGRARHQIARLLDHHDRYDRDGRTHRLRDDDDRSNVAGAVEEARDYYFDVPRASTAVAQQGEPE